MQAETAETYQGWTNHETWGCALILDNDRGTYELSREQLAEIKQQAPEASQVKDGIWTEEQTVRFQFADRLKDLTEALCGFDSEFGVAEPSQMASQLLRGAIDSVNYEERPTLKACADRYLQGLSRSIPTVCPKR